MNKPISTLTGQTYRHLAKPLLFRFAPDAVHSATLSLGKKVQNSQQLRHTINKLWAYNNPLLEQTVHGITFCNPIGLSAGFDKNIELAPLMKSIGFGFMEGGSVSHQACAGNQKPWFHRLPHSQSIVVHAGLPNNGIEQISKNLEQLESDTFTDFPLNISVAASNLEHITRIDQRIADMLACITYINKINKAQLITLNISCPNTFGGEPFTTTKHLELLLSAIDGLKLKVPLFIKMPSSLSWPQLDQLLTVAARHYVQGVTLCNLVKDRGEINHRDTLDRAVKGGLSGKPVQKISDYFIQQTYKHYGKRFTIIGVGGVFSADDAYRKITLGAHLVELITGMIFQGPQLIGRLNAELAQKLTADGFKNITEAIGVNNQ